jgi:hypothetical protein
MFCCVKNKFPEADPKELIYNQTLVFIKSSEGEWIQFKYMNRKFRLEVYYIDTYKYAMIRTYEILYGDIDRSINKYNLIEGMDIIISKEALTNSKNVALTELANEYIDLLWDLVIEPMKN